MRAPRDMLSARETSEHQLHARHAADVLLELVTAVPFDLNRSQMSENSCAVHASEEEQQLTPRRCGHRRSGTCCPRCCPIPAQCWKTCSLILQHVVVSEAVYRRRERVGLAV